MSAQVNDRATLVSALRAWACPGCGGSKVYKHRGKDRAGEWIEGFEMRPCTKCQGSGLHPTAAEALRKVGETI